MSIRAHVNKMLPSLMRVGALSLVLQVLILTFASVSPAFHNALHVGIDVVDQCEQHSHEHSDDSDADHSCAVTLFDRNGVDLTPAIELAQRENRVLGLVPQLTENSWGGEVFIRYCSRAPPIESFV